MSFTSLHVKFIHLCRAYISLLTLCMVACVAEQPLEGGPPDETPLQLVASFPKQEALNFKGKKIRATFNKDIATEGNLYSNLVVMPTLDQPQKNTKNKQPYSYTISGRTLEIKLNVPLKEDTTYSWNLNKAIKDTHEGIKATNATLTFSTGSFIDPITANGKIQELLTNKPVENVHVFLYNAERDPKTWQNPEKGKESTPDYYTTSDKEGNFHIEHIRLGKYYIRATTGEKNKYEIDYEKDKYGFLKDPIDLNTSQEAIIVPLITADVRDLKHLYTKPIQKGICEIAFNKEIKKYQLTALQAIGAKGKPQLYSFLSEKSPKSIYVYNTFSMLEGEPFMVKLNVEDNFHNSLEKNMPITFKEGKISPTHLTCHLTQRPLPTISPSFTETISFSKPIQELKRTCIYFECKNKGKILLKDNELSLNTDKSKLTIKKDFSPEEIMQFIPKEKEEEKQDKNKTTKSVVILQLEEGACQAFDKECNKQISVTYPLREAAETGTIKGHIDTAASHFMVELLNEQATTVVDTIRDKKDYCFTMVPVGTYKIRVRLLNEGEEEWSPGNIRKNIEPNPVIFYDKDISVVATWDITGIDLKF